MAIYRGAGGSGDATTDASSEATVATEKAAEAAASAVAAANSATLAEASYDSFDDRYLGPKSAAPSVDNDGNSLLTGALYFNSSSNDLYVWNGSAWEQAALTLSSANIITALGYTPVPNTRTLTINGTAYDLSANRTWTITGDSLLPSQSGNSGKVLTTNGTTTSWATDATGVASFNSRTGAVTLSSADVITALATGSIDTVKLADSSVTTAKIAADAITNAKIADDAVDTENIADDAITSALIDDNAVVTAGIADDAVTEAKLANAINTAIAANTAKTGITSGQASAITANTAKTGITSGQASAITANTAKTGITSGQASEITANTAKTGITSGQASAITANTAKVTNATHTGDVTGATSLTIASNVVGNAQLINTEDFTVNGLTVGKGANAVATNTVLGDNALDAAVTGGNNVAVGLNTLTANTSGTQNVAVGSNALDANTTTSNNTAVGSNALGATTGAGNTGLGESAGSSTLTGSNNTMLGSGAQPSASSVSNEITLGDGSATKVRMGNGDPIYDTGTILQVVSNTPDTGVVNTTNTAWANLDGDLETAITPKNASSTLILEAVFTFGGNNNTGISYQKFYDITNAADVNLSTAGSRTSCHACVRNQDYDANDCVMVTMMTTVSAGSTTARTYGIYNRCENTTQASYFGNPSNSSALGYAKSTFKITEVLA
jgi:hypothetical protein